MDINKAQLEELNRYLEQFCSACECDPCDCGWGTEEDSDNECKRLSNKTSN